MKIEKGIPIPSVNKQRSKWWPITNEMQVGDSVFFENSVDAERLRCHMKVNKIPYTLRKIEGGTRVWRKEN